MRALAYYADAEWGTGLHTTASFGPLVEVGVYSLVSSGLYGTVVGGQLGLHPKRSGHSELNLETEYGLQMGTGAGGFRFGGEVWGDDASLNASWQQTAAGYQGALEDSYSLDLSSSLYLDEVSSTYASAKFNQKESYQPGDLLISRPEKFGRSWSGRVSTLVSGVGLSLKYEDSDGFDVIKLSTRHKRELTFGVSSPLADDFLLTQEMSWLQETKSTVNDELLGYEAGARFALEGSSLTPRVGGEYSLLNNSFSKVSLGVDWIGLVTDTDSLILDLGGELELSGNRAVKLSTKGSYEFANGQALDLDLSGRVYFDHKPSLNLALGYNISFDVPLSRLSNVGEVKGRFEDEVGTAIPGLIVQVAGLSVVTAEDGSFTFPAIPEGDHVLVVNAADTMSDKITVPALPHSVHLSAGETVEANFRVIRSAAIQGQVRLVQTEGDDDAPQTEPGSDIILGTGQPEQDAGLVANLVVELRKGERVFLASTDSQGHFQVQDLPPGTWQLTVLRGELSELYRLEPETQSLTTAPGTTARVEVDLIPVARSIQFMDGGVLSGG